MNPFTAGKDIMKLRSEAKKMQEQMKQVMATGESKKGLIKVTLNGAQELVDININDELFTDKVELKKHMKDAFSDAQKKIQKEMAKGMDLDKIRGMFGM